MKKYPYIHSDAYISDCMEYRYWLTRSWGAPNSLLVELPIIMLNPSRGDAYIDDPTLRRCVSFADSFGYNGIRVMNLFALRTHDPSLLERHHDPNGPLNNQTLKNYFTYQSCAQEVLLAWGTKGVLFDRDLEVLRMLKKWKLPTSILCLGQTKKGHPKHPLYLPSDCATRVFQE